MSIVDGVLVACLAVAGSASEAGQTPQPPPEQFRAGTAVVLLDVVVRDKSGRPVRDLGRNEVQVLENGEPCEIQSFRRIERSATTAATGTALAPPAPARSEERVTSGGSFVSLVFDRFAAEDGPAASRAANDFVLRFLHGGSREQVAVFAIWRTLEVLQGFTTDAEAVRRAITLATSRPPRDKSVTGDAIRAAREADQANSNAVAPAVDLGDASQPSRERVVADPADARFREVMARTLRATDEAQRWQQGSDTLQPLLALASAQAGLPGRKTLLFFSPGLDVPEPLRDLYRSTVSAANRANVSVYAVDVRGLRAQSDMALVGEALQQSVNAARREQQTSRSAPEDLSAAVHALDAVHLNPQQALADLAAETGGFLLANANRFGAGMDRIAADIGGYYEIAYAPVRAEYDGTFRKIEVRAGRKDAVVQTRSGYIARPLFEDALGPGQRPLLAALTAGAVAGSAAASATTAAASVPHRVAAIRLADAGSFPEMLLLLEVPKEGLTSTREGSGQSGRVSALGLVRDARGLVVATMSHEGGGAGEHGPASSQGLLLERTLRLPAGHYVLETAVQDVATGRVGTRRTGFDVPEFRSGPVLGSVAMAQRVPGAGRTELPPLRASGLGVIPTMGRQLPQGTPEIGVFFTARAPEGSRHPRLSLEYRKDGEVFARDEPELPPADAAGRISFLGRIPSAGLAPGRYEVWVRLADGDAEVTEATSFVIAPRPAGAPVTAQAPSLERRLRDIRSPEVPLAIILDRAGDYVTRYAESFRNVVADELYRQWLVDAGTGGTTTRTLRSDLVYVSVPGSLPWGTFRDVYELDGHTLGDREGRLAKLFGRPNPDAVRQAREILKEGSRYNLGFAYRNVNSPTLGMLLLLPDNQRRLEFVRKSERTVAGLRGVEIAFRESHSSTLVRDQWNNDVRSHGRFWIDATRGAVLRTEIEYDLAANTSEDPEDRKTGSVATEYRLEPGLGVLVPDSMKELYRLGPTRIEGTARYSKYRRFSVTTSETTTVPPRQP